MRTKIIAARRTMPAAARERADAALVAAATRLAREHRVVCAYAPMLGEPGGADLPEALHATGVELRLPVLQPDLDLAWARWSGEWGPIGLAGVRVPAGPVLDVWSIAEAGIVLVPALAADHGGVRLGRGGGSYDRALARVRAGTPIVALLYETELVDRVPAQPHDVRVTHVLTPAGLTESRWSPDG